ncbi:polyprenyl synthetase family protein [bacterium]|nr:polyprenyl synthetase family protein [bacterium]
MLGASLKMGAIIGGGAKEDADNLYEFGRKIGIAFQVRASLGRLALQGFKKVCIQPSKIFFV